ncbi:MAG: B12-binding domain-containing radical SAM protein [Candidatus Omnitrophica bacterium]|nr:B12-binding domain-containing radical SAM protein [Candidatus Omnitrophota bacterium]
MQNRSDGVIFFTPPYEHLIKKVRPIDLEAIPLVPIGSASVFSYISQKSNISCHFYHGADYSPRVIRNEIVARRPSVVAISCFSRNRFACLEIARIAKLVDASIRVVLGGPHPTFLDEQILRHYSFVDYIVRGEGEVTFYELVMSLRQGTDPAKVEGISFRQNGHVVRTKTRMRLPSLDGMPPIDYSVILEGIPVRHLPQRVVYRLVPIETSRGCPFECSFCSTVGMWGRKVTYRSVEQVVSQLKILVSRGIREFLFHDMNFTLDRLYVRNLCLEIKRCGLDISWICMTRLTLVDEKILRLMKDAGCFVVIYGMESFSREVLKRLGKSDNLDLLIKNINLTAELGLKTDLNFIIGLPGETEKSLFEAMNNRRKLHPDVRVSAEILKVMPGSPLYGELVRKGFDESYWLKEHRDSVPYYTGVLPLTVLKKWEKVFNVFFKERIS